MAYILRRFVPVCNCATASEVLSISDNVIIQTRPCQASAPCPTCAHLSGRLHSRYQRTLAHLLWQGRPVALQVQARRFRCLNPACARQTFAERLPGVASAAGRRTERLGSLQGCLGLVLAAARIRLNPATGPLLFPNICDIVLVVERGSSQPPTPMAECGWVTDPNQRWPSAPAFGG